MVGRALQILLGLFVVVRLLLSKPACYYWGESHSWGKTNWWGCLVCCVGKSKRPNFFAGLICMDSNLTSSRNFSTRLLSQESLSICYRIWRDLPKEQQYKIKAEKDDKIKKYFHRRWYEGVYTQLYLSGSGSGSGSSPLSTTATKKSFTHNHLCNWKVDLTSMIVSSIDAILGVEINNLWVLVEVCLWIVDSYKSSSPGAT